MIQTILKSGLRLNRTLAITCLFFAGLMIVSKSVIAHTPMDWVWMVRFGSFTALSILGLLVNEAALKLLKRYPQSDPLYLDKFGLLAPLFTFGFVWLSFLISGLPAVGLLGLAVVLQTHLYGHSRLAHIGLAITGVLLFVGHAYHLSQPLFANTLLEPICLGVPLFVALTQVGQQMGVVVRSSSSQLNRLQSLAATDGLTGLVNRRQFNHQLQSEIARAKRHALPLSLALFDIDNFKKLNDTYGHPIGDRILKELGKLVTQNIRECDISARYGGEEFALILPETRQMEAYELLERLRALVERTVFCLPDNPLTISISVGVAQMDFNQPTAVSLVEKADAALYEAKRKGKNQVVFGTIPTPKITLSRSKSLQTP